MSRSSRTLYVGNLPGDIREREVEDLFYKYGPIVHIELKVPPRPPGYAFVEFEEARDADDAIRGRDGYDFDGHKLRVELAHGGRGNSSFKDRYSSHSSGRGGRGGVSRRSDYRVLVTGLPSSASWQDLKDHMRRAGDVCFSQVFREGGGTTGIVDYTNYDDMKYAIRKLDDTEFRNAFSRGYIHVKEYDSSHSRSRSRSKSRGYSRSHSRSLRLEQFLLHYSSIFSNLYEHYSCMGLHLKVLKRKWYNWLYHFWLLRYGALCMPVLEFFMVFLSTHHGFWEHEESWIWIAIVELDFEQEESWKWIAMD
ncbi:hypothetical protein R6Q57_007151 [Mikania cordata]